MLRFGVGATSLLVLFGAQLAPSDDRLGLLEKTAFCRDVSEETCRKDDHRSFFRRCILSSWYCVRLRLLVLILPEEQTKDPHSVSSIFTRLRALSSITSILKFIISPSSTSRLLLWDETNVFINEFIIVINLYCKIWRWWFMRDLMSGIRFVPYLQKAVGSFVAHHDETTITKTPKRPKNCTADSQKTKMLPPLLYLLLKPAN